MPPSGPVPLAPSGQEPTMMNPMQNRPGLVAEAIGAFVLVVAAGAAIATSGGSPVVVAATLGAAFAAMWWVFGDTASGHFNPALTVAQAVARRRPARDAMPTIAAQVAGAVLGGAALFAILDGRPFGAGGASLATTAPDLAGWSVLSVLVLEALVTAVFALAWLRLGDRPGDALPKGLALGALYAGTSLATLGLTWSALNPLRTLGPALLAGADLAAVAVFWVAALAGGALAAAVFLAVVEPQGATAPEPATAQA